MSQIGDVIVLSFLYAIAHNLATFADDSFRVSAILGVFNWSALDRHPLGSQRFSDDVQNPAALGHRAGRRSGPEPELQVV